MENLLKARQGETVLWVVRHGEEARRFQRLVVMRDGRVAEQGRTEEVLARMKSPSTELAAQ
jgi:ABC-type transport system involved in cytochrome bd biosynthesis fused ATPase/permease subunit